MTGVMLLAVLALALAGAATCLALKLVLTHDLSRPEAVSRKQRPVQAVARKP